MNRKTVFTGFKILSVATMGAMLLMSSVANADTPKSNHAKVETDAKKSDETTTPIKHVVVIFGENVSFDHYFGTYPYSLNVKGEPKFIAKANTPEVNNLLTPKDYNGTQPNISKTNLITDNPNGVNPVRLDRSQVI